VDETTKLHDKAVSLLSSVIERTSNVTLLKKIIASNEDELSEQAFDRLADIAFGDENGEALLEVIVLCKRSGKLEKKVKDRMSFIKQELDE
jgi:hypothetical protein